MKKTDYVKGIYKSYDEFVNQKPSITEFTRIDRIVDNENVPEFYITTNEKHKERISPSDYFAVYDKRWFKSTAGGAIGMKKMGADFYIKYRVERQVAKQVWLYPVLCLDWQGLLPIRQLRSLNNILHEEPVEVYIL